MSLTLITASVGIPSERDEVVVAESAKEWLAAAGYVKVSEANTAQVHALIRLSKPCDVPNLGDAA
jgi:hypothetical protein